MPKDAAGADLKVGDLVVIPAVVTEVTDAEDGPNVTLRSVGLHSAESRQTTNFALNARQTVLAPDGRLPATLPRFVPPPVPPVPPPPAKTPPPAQPSPAPSAPPAAGS